MNSPQPPSNSSDQHCANPMGGAWPKPGTAPSGKPTTASQARPRCRSTPDPIEHPGECIWAHVAKNRQPPSWWQGFRSLYKDKITGRLTNNMIQQITRKQAVASRLPTVQEEVVGWWEASLSICGPGQQDFLQHCDFCGTRDLRETWKEGTLVLAKALQCCRERLGHLLGCYVMQYAISRGAWSPSCV